MTDRETFHAATQKGRRAQYLWIQVKICDF